MEFTSLSDLLIELRRRVRDFGDGKWSSLDKAEALRSAFRHAQGHFATEAVYSSISFTAGVFDYAVPNYVDRIFKIERRPSVGLQGDSLLSLDWYPMVWWQLHPTDQTNFLHVDITENAPEVRVWYLADAPVLPPSQMTLAAAIAPAQTTLPVGPGAATLNIRDYPEQGWLALRQNTLFEMVRYNGINNTAFLNVTRGIEGAASSFPAGVLADPVLVMERGGAGYEFVLAKAEEQLWQYRMTDDAPGDRQETNFLLRWAKQRADEALVKLRQPRPAGQVRIGKRGRMV